MDGAFRCLHHFQVVGWDLKMVGTPEGIVHYERINICENYGESCKSFIEGCYIGLRLFDLDIIWTLNVLENLPQLHPPAERPRATCRPHHPTYLTPIKYINLSIYFCSAHSLCFQCYWEVNDVVLMRPRLNLLLFLYAVSPWRHFVCTITMCV